MSPGAIDRNSVGSWDLWTSEGLWLQARRHLLVCFGFQGKAGNWTCGLFKSSTEWRSHRHILELLRVYSMSWTHVTLIPPVVQGLWPVSLKILTFKVWTDGDHANTQTYTYKEDSAAQARKGSQLQVTIKVIYDSVFMWYMIYDASLLPFGPGVSVMVKPCLLFQRESFPVDAGAK